MLLLRFELNGIGCRLLQAGQILDMIEWDGVTRAPGVGFPGTGLGNGNYNVAVAVSFLEAGLGGGMLLLRFGLLVAPSGSNPGFDRMGWGNESPWGRIPWDWAGGA